jgi:hypothetical protein
MSLLTNLRYQLLEFLFRGYSEYLRGLHKGQLEILKLSVQRFNAETEKYRRNNALLQSYQKDILDAHSKINGKSATGLE